jgi:hypothetical protein
VPNSYLSIVASVNVKATGGTAAMNATTELQVLRSDATVIKVQPTTYAAPVTVNAVNYLVVLNADGTGDFTYDLQARHAPSGGAAVTVTYEVTEFTIEVRK